MQNLQRIFLAKFVILTLKTEALDWCLKRKNVVFIIFNSLKDGYCLNNELFINMNEKMSCIIILEQGTESSSKHDGVEWPLGVFIIFYFKY